MRGEEVLEAPLDDVPEGLVVHDPETGAIVDANRRYCELLGYDRETVRELSVADVTADDWTPPVGRADFVRRAAAEGTVECEWRAQRADGDPFWAEVRLAPVELGERRWVVGSVREVTKRKERERQLRVLDRVLRHNLYNDMNVVRSRAELIGQKAEGDLADRARAIIDKVDDFVDTADKEREVVKLILEGGDRRRIDVASTVTRRVERVRSAHPDATVTADVTTDSAVVATTGFGRAVEELVQNAVVHNDRKTPTVAVSAHDDGDDVVVTVADDGPGVPDQEADILTGTRRVAPLYHGSGLGLWLVNWVVQLSGGETTVTDNDPRGTVVTVRQPTV